RQAVRVQGPAVRVPVHHPHVLRLRLPTNRDHLIPDLGPEPGGHGLAVGVREWRRGNEGQSAPQFDPVSDHRPPPTGKRRISSAVARQVATSWSVTAARRVSRLISGMVPSGRVMFTVSMTPRPGAVTSAYSPPCQVTR